MATWFDNIIETTQSFFVVGKVQCTVAKYSIESIVWILNFSISPFSIFRSRFLTPLRFLVTTTDLHRTPTQQHFY